MLQFLSVKDLSSFPVSYTIQYRWVTTNRRFMSNIQKLLNSLITLPVICTKQPTALFCSCFPNFLTQFLLLRRVTLL
jgi:hypothetical protein